MRASKTSNTQERSIKRLQIDPENGLRLLVNEPRRKVYLVTRQQWEEHRNGKQDIEMVLDIPQAEWLKLLYQELIIKSKCGVFRWLWHECVERGYVFVLVFVGDKQSGKTVACIDVCFLYNFLASLDIPLEDVYSLRADQLFSKINEKVRGNPLKFLRSGSTLMLDEGSVELNPTGHHVEDEVADLVKIFSIFGDAKINIGVTEPELRVMGPLKPSITKLFHMGVAGGKFGHFGRRGWGLLKKITKDDNHRTPGIWTEHKGIKFPPLNLETYLKYRPLKTQGTHKIAEESITRMIDRRERRERKILKMAARQRKRAQRNGR